MTVPTEDHEQIMLCKWLDLKKIDYFAVPNGGSRNAIEAKNLKAQGVKPGVSDLVVFTKYKILFVEMKRAKKSLSKVSQSQMEFLGKIQKYHYALGVVCYGFDDAKEFIESQIK